jgi:HAMP domain-containing protein
MDADAFIRELKKRIAAQDRELLRTRHALEQCDPDVRIAMDLDEIEAPTPVHRPNLPIGAIRA